MPRTTVDTAWHTPIVPNNCVRCGAEPPLVAIAFNKDFEKQTPKGTKKISVKFHLCDRCNKKTIKANAYTKKTNKTLNSWLLTFTFLLFLVPTIAGTMFSKEVGISTGYSCFLFGFIPIVLLLAGIRKFSFPKNLEKDFRFAPVQITVYLKVDKIRYTFHSVNNEFPKLFAEANQNLSKTPGLIFCDLCDAEVTSEDYCQVATMPHPIQPGAWYLTLTDSSGGKKQVSGSKPSAQEIGRKLSQTFAKQSSVRELQSSTKKVKTLNPKIPNLTFEANSGKLYFCPACVNANGGEMTKTGVAFVKGAAKKRSNIPVEEKLSSEKDAHTAKPLKVNLGDVEDFVLETIVRNNSSSRVMAQKTGAEGISGMEAAHVTPKLASQTLQARRHEQRADDLADSGRYREAAEEYRRAIKIAPYNDEVLYMSLGGVLSALGKYREALRYLKIASKINPYNPDVAMSLDHVKEKVNKG